MRCNDLLAPNVIHFFFFFNDTATTEIYTLSLHDALPISFEDLQLLARLQRHDRLLPIRLLARHPPDPPDLSAEDRKSTRLNSSHSQISYAVFCLKKKKKKPQTLYHSTLSN